MRITRIVWVTLLVLVGIALFFDNLATAQSDDPFAASSTDFQRWGPRLPDDAIMPNPDVIKRVESWSRAAFSGKDDWVDSGTLSFQVLRQDHNTTKFDESCMATPLKIGSRSFARGLGTHANSEIRVTFPEPVTKFSAIVGVDNNYDTGGVRGSVQFAVVVNDRELARTRTLRGSDEALVLEVALPENTTVLTLIADATSDGTGWDQADWCEPVAIGVSGNTYHLSDTVSLPMDLAIPFSFQYGGVNSSELLPIGHSRKKASTNSIPSIPGPTPKPV